MPSVRIKSKANTECRQSDYLHRSHKSAKTRKTSRTQAKVFQQRTELATFFQTNQDDSSIMEVSIHNSTSDGIDGSFTQLLKPSCSPDLASITRLWESRLGRGYFDSDLLDTKTSNLETIFSSNLDFCVSQLKPENHSDEDKYEHPRLPHLVVTDESEDGTCVSCEYQTCNSSYFFDFEGISALPFDNSIETTDVSNSTFPIHEFMSSDTMIDMPESYMVMPFPERAVEINSIHDERSVQETMVNFDEACSYFSVHPENEMNCDFGHLEEIEPCDQQLILKSLPYLPEAVSSAVFSPETQAIKPITLVLDLDETLVHSTMEHCNDADFTFPIFFDMKHHTVYVRRRPFLQMFLERVAQMFQIIIFTASQSIYAEKLLDILDPDSKIISKRVYRDSCVFSDGNYTKDLTILGIDLAKVAIVDNTPQVFCLQVNNGIPIKSWFGDPLDEALVQLLPFLETLVDAEDVRPIIAKKFGNNE